METKLDKVKTELKNEDNLISLTTELNHLKEVNGCYNHFLASYEATQMPVAYARILMNKSFISQSINELHLRIDIEKANITETVHKGTTYRKYSWTDLDKEALLAFNGDPRYTITE